MPWSVVPSRGVFCMGLFGRRPFLIILLVLGLVRLMSGAVYLFNKGFWLDRTDCLDCCSSTARYNIYLLLYFYKLIRLMPPSKNCSFTIFRLSLSLLSWELSLLWSCVGLASLNASLLWTHSVIHIAKTFVNLVGLIIAANYERSVAFSYIILLKLWQQFSFY